MPFIDFAEVKRNVSIEQAAENLNLELKKSGTQLRGMCPACGDGDDRTLAITPARNLFYCFSEKKGGDQIALVQHITGNSAQDAAAFLSPHTRAAHNPPVMEQKKAVATKPTKTGGRFIGSGEKPTNFDPAAFASKLTYTEEVSALGISEEHAKQFGIGFCSTGSMRGFTCFPITDGVETHYIGWNGSELKLPKWKSNIVKLRRA